MAKTDTTRTIVALIIDLAVMLVATLMLLASFAPGTSGNRSASRRPALLPSLGTSFVDATVHKVFTSLVDGEAEVDMRAVGIVADLTTEQKVAQLFFVTPEDLLSDKNVSAVTVCGDLTKQGLKERPVGGIIYFRKNLESEEQATKLLTLTQETAQDACGVPILLGVDEEGGTVSRIGTNPGFDFADVGDMRAIGNTGDDDRARDVAHDVGACLADLGFTANLAPVADVADNPDSDVMARRSFGSDKDLVAQMVAAQVEAYRSEGIICCAKHFPGIGGAVGDSHDDLIKTNKTLDELLDNELVPFAAAIDAGVPMVMVGHIACPAVTGDDTPASLSPTIMGDVLRDRLGFTGVVVTDSLQMGAVNAGESGDLAVRSFLAGADALLMPTDFDAAYDAVLAAVKNGEISPQRLDLSVIRIVRMKLAYERG